MTHHRSMLCVLHRLLDRKGKKVWEAEVLSVRVSAHVVVVYVVLKTLILQ
jgi:hypothetical protein